jgi:hypothetical protein
VRRGAPALARQLALRVLERVERAGAFADVLLRALLGHGGLSTVDRAFATELVHGTLRWRGRLDFLLAQVLDGDLDKLEPLVANALRLLSCQIATSRGIMKGPQQGRARDDLFIAQWAPVRFSRNVAEDVAPLFVTSLVARRSREADIF